jgi:hypothetical protein
MPYIYTFSNNLPFFQYYHKFALTTSKLQDHNKT